MLKHGNNKQDGSKGEDELEGEGEGEDSEYLEDEGSTEVVASEAVTEIRSLNTAEWLSLEREHAINESDSNGQQPPKKRKLSP